MPPLHGQFLIKMHLCGLWRLLRLKSDLQRVCSCSGIFCSHWCLCRVCGLCFCKRNHYIFNVILGQPNYTNTMSTKDDLRDLAASLHYSATFSWLSLGFRNDRFKCIPILKIDRINASSLGKSQVSLCLFQKSTGSMEPVETALTTALLLLCKMAIVCIENS